MSALLTIREVARITKLHEMTIRRYIRSGKLDAVRVGRQIRIRPEALEKLMTPVEAHGDEERPYLQDGDPVFDLVGLGEGRYTGVSSDKYRYFAEVFR
jgi:excisionase family DNA binding protein